MIRLTSTTDPNSCDCSTWHSQGRCSACKLTQDPNKDGTNMNQGAIRLGPEITCVQVVFVNSDWRCDAIYEDIHNVRFRAGCVHIEMHNQDVYSHPLSQVKLVKQYITRENEDAA